MKMRSMLSLSAVILLILAAFVCSDMFQRIDPSEPSESDPDGPRTEDPEPGPDPEQEPADLGYDVPNGFAVDYGTFTISNRDVASWTVVDLLAPFCEKVGTDLVEYRGFIVEGDSVTLGPGLFRISSAGEVFEFGFGGLLERSVSWTYDTGSGKEDVSVSFAIDVGRLLEQREIAQTFNGDGHSRLFSELPSLAVRSEEIDTISRSLRSEFERIGGDPGNAQSYADFIASFVQLPVTYPARVAGMGEDYSIYGQDEYWAMPLQTLCLMQGDCEDKAVLLSSIYLASGFQSAVGGISGHVFAGVHLESFEETSKDRLKELDRYRHYRIAASVPVEGSCDEGISDTVFYAVETIHGQIPVGYLTSGSDYFGKKTLWGIAGLYPCSRRRTDRPPERSRGSTVRRMSRPCRSSAYRRHPGS